MRRPPTRTIIATAAIFIAAVWIGLLRASRGGISTTDPRDTSLTTLGTASLSTPYPALRAGPHEVADAETAPDSAFQLFVRMFFMLSSLMVYHALARKRREAAAESANDESAQADTQPMLSAAALSADAAAALRQVVDGYNRLRDGLASAADVDELRTRARSLLTASSLRPLCELRGLKALLQWLDQVRTSGSVTIQVQRLREGKIGAWDIECGIEAGGRAIKIAKRVTGTAQVEGCALQVPWDASGAIKLWMHLTDTGYEKCWGHFGPIAMSSTQVLQDPSGMVREFHTDDFDKDFKLIFTIKRNFPSLPSIEVGDQT
jgi:cbb3-type cytochrome oxidase subunit 3